jgi:hypothetical protein
VTTLLETNLTIQGNQMNLIMKKVASWAAIIAVPTAITGWFGQSIRTLVLAIFGVCGCQSGRLLLLWCFIHRVQTSGLDLSMVAKPKDTNSRPTSIALYSQAAEAAASQVIAAYSTSFGLATELLA